MSILPTSTDGQGENGHHVCPTCGKEARKAVSRVTGVGTVNTDCICTTGHLWSVHWMGAA
jgi:hypothetical protein